MTIRDWMPATSRIRSSVAADSPMAESVNRIVATRLEMKRRPRGHGHVNEEPHPASLYRLVLGEAGCIAKCLVDVSRLQIRVGCDDLFRGLACGQQPKKPRNRETQVTNARLARADVGPARDALELHAPIIDPELR